jgi:hypothetical protein
LDMMAVRLDQQEASRTSKIGSVDFWAEISPPLANLTKRPTFLASTRGQSTTMLLHLDWKGPPLRVITEREAQYSARFRRRCELERTIVEDLKQPFHAATDELTVT